MLEPYFVRGNVDSSIAGSTNVSLEGTGVSASTVEPDLSDAVTILDALFLGREVACLDAADTDDNGIVDVADAIRLLNFLYQGGSDPAAPFPLPGPDPEDDAGEEGKGTDHLGCNLPLPHFAPSGAH
jgi:hypothetical protein